MGGWARQLTTFQVVEVGGGLQDGGHVGSQREGKGFHYL